VEIPVLELMQVEHTCFELVNSKDVVPQEQITNFLDLCSKVVDSFVSHIIIVDNSEYHNDMFSVVNTLIDNFEILFENDDPVEFFGAKQDFKDNIFPKFSNLMKHFSLCVQKPRPLKNFYLKLIDKIENIFNKYIEGTE